MARVRRFLRWLFWFGVAVLVDTLLAPVIPVFPLRLLADLVVMTVGGVVVIVPVALVWYRLFPAEPAGGDGGLPPPAADHPSSSPRA